MVPFDGDSVKPFVSTCTPFSSYKTKSSANVGIEVDETKMLVTPSTANNFKCFFIVNPP